MLQIIIVSLYVAVTIAIGIWTKRKTESSRTFDGAELGVLLCVVAGAGEWLGGTATTGVAEYGYEYGLSGAWYTIANGMGICFLAICFARLFRSLGTSTVSGIIGRFLGERARRVSAALLILVMIAVGCSQMVAIGTLGEELFRIDATASILILGTGVLLYTVLGGMMAVGYTNILHMAVMYMGSIIAVIACLTQSGGAGQLKTMLPASYFSMDAIGISKIGSWLTASVLGACVAQAGLQPILASKDENAAVKSSYMIALLVAPFGIMSAILGMIAKVRFPSLENAKHALPALLMSMNPIIGGFVMASIMAAILSTASPIFLACGTLFTRDIYLQGKKGERTDDKKILRVSRGTTFAAGFFCIIMALVFYNSQRLLDLVYFAYSIRGSLFIVLLLGIYWKRTSEKAAIYAMWTTGAVGLFWVIYKNRTGSYPILPQLSETYAAVITAFGVAVVGSVLTEKINSKKIDKREQKEGRKMMFQSVIARVYEHAQETPDKVAVITCGGGVETTYRKLYSLVGGYASFLYEKGLRKGDIVVAKASQTLEYVVLYLGVHLAGGVITSAETHMSAEGIAGIARAVKAKMVIGDDRAVLNACEADYLDSADVLNVAAKTETREWQFPAADDSADILFTTGTTGASKGVELSHKALVATAENLIYGCGYQKDTVLIVPGPLNHANPIRKLFTTLLNGSTIYILNGMTNMKAFFTALNYPNGRIACCLPPSAIRTIFQLTRDEIGSYADRIDFIESATAPLPEPDKERLCELLPQTRLLNNYGSSEAASVCMYDYSKYPGRVGCIGKAMPHSRIFIVNDNKEEIVSSKENMGLLACEGDVNMKGYLNEPELTRDVLIDGVVYTNDIGYIDEEGFVYIAGRKGDVINVGGLKVAPTEVEEAALAIDGIEDCICLPMDHPITGQALKLLVVMREGAGFVPKQFTAFLKTRLENHKVPIKYEQVESIARTYNGKLDRKAYQK